MAGNKHVMYVTPGGKMAVRRVVTNGRVQKAFKEQIGRPMGACMQKAKGVSNVAERKNIVRSCAAQFSGKKLTL